MGQHVNHNNGWPVGVPFGNWRGWDSHGAQWVDIQTNATTYVWTDLDQHLADLHTAGVNNVLYTLSRTPQFALSTADKTDASCSISNGQCDIPSDLNSDGTGTDAYWKAWVTAIATRVNDSTYKQTHAHIKYWEPWNEWQRNDLMGYACSVSNPICSYRSTYDAMVRLVEDARCIITGKGTIHNSPSFGTFTACTAAPIDANAQILAPSVNDDLFGMGVNQNFLYCNHSPKGAQKCDDGSAGSAAVDVINMHTYYVTGPPEGLVTKTAAIKATLSTTDQSKPLWSSEGSWGLTQNTIYDTDDKKEAFIPRYVLMLASNGWSQMFWYAYNGAAGDLWKHVLLPPATAWTATWNWLQFASPVVPPGCTVVGTVWSCPYDNGAKINTKYYQVMWDTAGTCVAGVCTTTNITVGAQYLHYLKLDLTTVPIVSNIVPVGLKAILLENQ
jgi:hypothetical protein